MTTAETVVALDDVRERHTALLARRRDLEAQLEAASTVAPQATRAAQLRAERDRQGLLIEEQDVLLAVAEMQDTIAQLTKEHEATQREKWHPKLAAKMEKAAHSLTAARRDMQAVRETQLAAAEDGARWKEWINPFAAADQSLTFRPLMSDRVGHWLRHMQQAGWLRST